jgi:hypothetical protein
MGLTHRIFRKTPMSAKNLDVRDADARFQGIRTRLLGLLGVDHAASHAVEVAQPVQEHLRRFANVR